ncbi:TPM domain-containing protein [Dyella sp.]|uniref:TPM domain-containing protein n=1 Tax=Dyella sp. TaxID=1869338 RepID=UPI003F822B28
MERVKRLFLNGLSGWFQLGRRFPPKLLDELARAIGQGEQSHLAQIRFAVESRLPLGLVWRGVSARERARQVFAEHGVWDTESNNGVLVYVLLAERRIEIVADRGFTQIVDPTAWDAVCARMQVAFAAGRWREGSLAGLGAVHELAQHYFPADGHRDSNELPDRPILL